MLPVKVKKVEMIFSSQKKNQRTNFYYYKTSGQFFFVRFLVEIEEHKKTFQN